MNILNSILETIGDTPLVRLQNINSGSQGTILAKIEFFNPSSSVKDRIALKMIDKAEERGLLSSGGTIVEPTSGNTGLGLATVAAARGYNLIITMPETMSMERRHLLKQLGAEIILTPAEKGMAGALQKAEEIIENTKNGFMPAQFSNPENPKTHYETTGPEIWNATEGDIDIFISGIGTGGTLMGCGKFFKEKNSNIKIIAVEPSKSSVLSGNSSGKHSIQGIGAGFIPDIVDMALIDDIITIKDSDALRTSRLLAKKEGILSGISSGANINAAMQLARKKENKNKTIVTVVCDTGERYLSTELFA